MTVDKFSAHALLPRLAKIINTDKCLNYYVCGLKQVYRGFVLGPVIDTIIKLIFRHVGRQYCSQLELNSHFNLSETILII